MESASGESLAWYWKGMFVENYRLDQAVTSVTYPKGGEKEGALVTIENLDQMAMPVYLHYETVSGKKDVIKIPVEIWQNGSKWIQKIPATEKLSSVTIDPDNVFPDINVENNSWKAQ